MIDQKTIAPTPNKAKKTNTKNWPTTREHIAAIEDVGDNILANLHRFILDSQNRN